MIRTRRQKSSANMNTAASAVHVSAAGTICQRRAISWQRRFAYDVTYVERWTWKMEVRILIDTVKVVLGRQGLSHETHTTMPEFTGTAQVRTNNRHLSSIPGGPGRGFRATPSSVTPHLTGLELLAVELETSVS